MSKVKRGTAEGEPAGQPFVPLGAPSLASEADAAALKAKVNGSSGAAARTRTLELFSYWLTLPSTDTFLQQAVESALQQLPRKDEVTPQKGGRSNQSMDDSRSAPLIAVDMGDLPIADGVHNTPSASANSSPSSSHTSSSHRMRTTLSAAKSPREFRMSPVMHNVDEMDAAHQRGALSPRASSPNQLLGQNLGLQIVTRSPMESGVALPSEDKPSECTVSALPLDLNLDSVFSAGSTLRTSHNETRSSRSSSPSGTVAEELGEATLSRRSSLASASRKADDPAAAAVAQPPLRMASYSDIPPFYYKEGKPCKNSLLSASKQVPPVHLQAQGLQAIAQLLQRQEAQRQQQQQQEQSPTKVISQLGGGGGGELESAAMQMMQAPIQPTSYVLPQLTSLSDEEVPGHIAKAFLAVPPIPKSTVSPTMQTRNSITANSRRPTTSQSAMAHYQQQLHNVMTKLCTTCFGLPSIFTKLLQRRITESLLRQPDAQGVKDFFETNLKGKPIVRRMFDLIKNDVSRNFLIRTDFRPMMEVILDVHPGLQFLKQAVDFQAKYVETVILRIFYDLDRFDRGRITWAEFETSKLPFALRHVDAADDINAVLDYFSYEHFYVLYCRFWELDADKDTLIGPDDLMLYFPDGTMNPRVVERIFQGCGRKLVCKVKNRMNYEDFVYFCICEEDKASRRSIQYWFRVLDVDGDGILSGYELEYFYSYTRSKMVQMTMESISFTDVMCQIADMMPFEVKNGILLRDLLAVPQAAFVALNMVLNVIKFLLFEQRDPFVAHHERLLGGLERNEWHRFARAEYDRMAADADEGAG